MNVRQLIEALSALDPDLPVMVPSRLHPEFGHVARVFADVMSPAKGGGMELCDNEDEGCTSVARLLEPGDIDDRDERPKPVTN
jgi:hypothetical protein